MDALDPCGTAVIAACAAQTAPSVSPTTSRARQRHEGTVMSLAGFQICPHAWQRQYAESLLFSVVLTCADLQNGQATGTEAVAGGGVTTKLIETSILIG